MSPRCGVEVRNHCTVHLTVGHCTLVGVEITMYSKLYTHMFVYKFICKYLVYLMSLNNIHLILFVI